jgi:beta-lactamase regulating signal transducer with metallopeptidase domain
LLLEAALRSLIMGAVIFAALRLMRIHQVRAQRTAWLLALAGALAMPALVAAHIGPRLLPDIAVLRAPAAVQSAKAQHPAESAMSGERPTIARAADDATRGAPPASSAVQAALRAAFAVYLMVGGVFLLRLSIGIAAALRLRSQSERTTLRFESPGLDPPPDIRHSPRVATPVTIASSIVLPSTYSSWDAATLRIALAHECAHVRQRDFHVQTLAGIHCAVFWFNPFSWWLQRRLSELAEALSDHAAVAHADSRASYAEVLLAFAVRGASPFAAVSAAVSMARSSNLAARIERLLNDRGFEESFAGKPRLPFVAGCVVLFAMAASTSTAVPPAAANATETRAAANPNVGNPDVGDTDIDMQTGTSVVGDADEQKDAFLAIHTGGSRTTFDTGRLLPSVAGDYIYFRHQGKTYVIQDPGILARARDLLAPMQEIGRTQRELGRQQAQLGRQQQSLGWQQATAKLGKPDFQHDIAELTQVLERMRLEQLAPQIDQRALAELEGKLGTIQADLGSLQAEFGTQHGKIAEQQAALGEQQGKLGEEQGRLGEQRRKLIEDATHQLQPLVEEAIRDGKAKPLQ